MRPVGEGAKRTRTDLLVFEFIALLNESDLKQKYRYYYIVNRGKGVLYLLCGFVSQYDAFNESDAQ